MNGVLSCEVCRGERKNIRSRVHRGVRKGEGREDAQTERRREVGRGWWMECRVM